MNCKDQWSHEFEGNICIKCGASQLFISGKELKKITPITIKKKNIHSEFQYEVDKLVTFLGEDMKAFPKYAKIYKNVGKDNIYRWVSTMKEKGIYSPKYFMGIYRNHNKRLLKSLSI